MVDSRPHASGPTSCRVEHHHPLPTPAAMEEGQKKRKKVRAAARKQAEAPCGDAQKWREEWGRGEAAAVGGGGQWGLGVTPASLQTQSPRWQALRLVEQLGPVEKGRQVWCPGCHGTKGALVSDVFLEGRHWGLGSGWRRNVTFISLLRWLHFHSEPLPGSFMASLTWAAHPGAGQARLLLPTTKPAPLPLCPISGKCQNLPFCSSPAPPTSIHPSAHRTLQILLESIHISYPPSLVQGPAAQMTHHWSALFYTYSFSSTFHVETRRHFFSLNFLGSL